MKVRSPIWVVFWILVLYFVAFLGSWPLSAKVVSMLLFFLLGIALLILTSRGRVDGLLKKFLILTASAAIAISIGYALQIVVVMVALSPIALSSGNMGFWMFPLTVGLFWAAMIAFVVGVVGSIILVRRQGRQATPPS